MGYDGAAINRIVPPFYQMPNENLLDQPMVTLNFGNVSNGESDQAEITLGGIDKNQCAGNLFDLPNRRKCCWEIDLDEVTFGNETIWIENADVAINTGTSLIGFPSTLAELL